MQVDCAYYLEAIERINTIPHYVKVHERQRFEKLVIWSEERSPGLYCKALLLSLYCKYLAPRESGWLGDFNKDCCVLL